jgi:biopolymer transport protein ExbD
MAHKPVEQDETLSEVNVIPLADLSLVLLIILMVMSPMITQALFHVTPSKAQQAENQRELATPETPILVTYEPTALKLNGTLMGSEVEFVKRLAEVMGRRRDKSVLISASPDVIHGKMVRIMDLVKRQGATSLVMLKWDRGNNPS